MMFCNVFLEVNFIPGIFLCSRQTFFRHSSLKHSFLVSITKLTNFCFLDENDILDLWKFKEDKPLIPKYLLSTNLYFRCWRSPFFDHIVFITSTFCGDWDINLIFRIFNFKLSFLINFTLSLLIYSVLSQLIYPLLSLLLDFLLSQWYHPLKSLLLYFLLS